MKNYRHLNGSDRANIYLFLNLGKSAAYIAAQLHLPRCTIQREIIRNRSKKEGKDRYGECKKLRYKYSVCNACPNRHKCSLVQYIYNDCGASEAASLRKHSANSGPRLLQSEFRVIDDEFYHLVAENGQSIEAAWHSSPILQKVSSLTLRRWAYSGYSRTRAINLRRKKNYQSKGKYDYSRQKKAMNFVRMPLRTIEDFKKFMKDNPGSVVIQTDSVEGKRTDRLAILTIYHKDQKLQLGYLYDRHNSSNEVYGFLERHVKLLLGTVADRPIVFVTDNGVEFASISNLEKISPRVRIFFARPYCSTDKSECERNHELL